MYCADECIRTTTVQSEDVRSAPSCLHVYHTLATNDHLTASLKLAVLSIILLTNVRPTIRGRSQGVGRGTPPKSVPPNEILSESNRASGMKI